MKINYALDISTGTTLSDASLGLTSGTFKLISGRDPNIAGYKNGLLIDIGPATQNVDIASFGAYSTMGGLSFSIANHTGFGQAVKDLGIDFNSCDVLYYSIHDGVFSEEGKYKVDSFSESDTEFRVSTMDLFRSIHKPVLKKVFTVDEFGDDLPSDLINKPIPNSFGYVAKSKLIPVIQRETLETICTSLSADYDIAPCTNYTSTGTMPNQYKTVHLKTVDKEFAENELRGKYLVAIKGGDQSRMITGNAASSGGTTQIHIGNPFDPTPDSNSYWSADGTAVWYFQISSLSIVYKASENRIFDYGRNNLNSPKVYVFNSTTKRFDDISYLVSEFSIGDSGNYPTISILTKPTDLDGNSTYYTFAIPESISSLPVRINALDSLTGTFPVSGTSLSALTDQNNSTGYTWVGNRTTAGGGFAEIYLPLKIAIPSEFLGNDFSNIYLAMNYSAIDSLDSGTQTQVGTRLIDFLGRSTDIIDGYPVLYGTTFGESSFPINMIPDRYFSPTSGTTNLAFENGKSVTVLGDGSIISKESDLRSYPFCVYELVFSFAYVNTCQISATLNEVTLVGEKNLNLLDSDLYTDLIGTTFETDWDGRRNPLSACTTIGDMVEYFIRRSDLRPDVIDTESFDAVSHPTSGTRRYWPVGMQYEDEISSYDAISDLCKFGFLGMVPGSDGKRKIVDWISSSSPVARFTEDEFLQVGEKELTDLDDVYNEFEVRYAKNPESGNYEGMYAIKNIDAPFFPSISAASGSSSVEVTFSEYHLNVGYPGMIQFVITEVEGGIGIGDYVTFTGGFGGLSAWGVPVLAIGEDSLFIADPGIVLLTSGVDYTGGSMVKYINSTTAWKTHAVGFSDSQYTIAKALWERSHLSYQKYGVIHPLPSDAGNVDWFIDGTGVFGLSAQQDSALNYLTLLCNWTAFRKEMIPYSVPNVSANAGIRLLHEIEFNDSVRTNGEDKRAWIVTRTLKPGMFGDSQGKDQIDFKVMLEPQY